MLEFQRLCCIRIGWLQHRLTSFLKRIRNAGTLHCEQTIVHAISKEETVDRLGDLGVDTEYFERPCRRTLATYGLMAQELAAKC